MQLTDDGYFALAKLEQWYRKCNHQIIDIAGIQGTGLYEVIQEFIAKMEFDPREVMYLSYDQKQVLEMAAKRMHAYYLPSIIYKYTKIVNFDTLPILNPASNIVEYQWKKDVRKKIDPKYRMIIVFDSVLMSHKTLNDLCSFGLPIILLRDPKLIPAPDTYTFLREPNIMLNQLHPVLLRNPIMYFANKVLRGEKLAYGSYDTVSIIAKKQLNLYNLKSPEMVITLSDEMMDSINKVYRNKVIRSKDGTNCIGERLIIMSNMYNHKLVNSNEKKVKVFLQKGLIGTISKCNKHAPCTRYIPINFEPEFYHDSFEDLYIDRNYLNGVDTPSRQQIPDEILYAKYAYALSVPLARLSHWNKITLIADDSYDGETQRILLYNAITRCTQSMTLVL